jgi:predicted nucleotidyltransferase
LVEKGGILANYRVLPVFGIPPKMQIMKCLDPVTENAVRNFLARIPADIQVERAILYGSRARGEHRPDSDADVALIVRELGGAGRTSMRLADLAYYSYVDTGIMVQPVAIAIEDWLNPEEFPRPGFLRSRGKGSSCEEGAIPAFPGAKKRLGVEICPARFGFG